jgi:O-antigen ligase
MAAIVPHGRTHRPTASSLTPPSMSALNSPVPSTGPAYGLPTTTNRWVAGLIGALVASLFLSTALNNLLAAFVCAAAGVYWYRYRPFGLLMRPLAWLCMAFMAWIIVRDLTAGSTLAATMREVNDFRPIIFLVFWAPLFAAPGHRRAAGLTFFACMTLFCVAALLSVAITHKHITDIGFNRGHDLSGPMMAVAIAAAIQLALAGGRLRRLWAGFAVLATATLFFATERRTGYVGFGAVMVALVVLNRSRLKPRAVLAAAVLAIALPAALLAISPNARERMALVFSESSQFAQTDVHKQRNIATSSGLRLRFWTVTAEVIKESPLLGSGLARFATRYNVHDALLGGSAEATGNPHNEYLYVTAGLGIVGLVLYLALQARVFLDGRRLPNETQRRILWLAMVTFMVSVLFNSMLIDMVPGHFYALVLLNLVWFPWPARIPGMPEARAAA